MGSFFRFLQLELCAAYSDVMTMLDKIFDTVFQCEKSRATFDESDVVDRE